MLSPWFILPLVTLTLSSVIHISPEGDVLRHNHTDILEIPVAGTGNVFSTYSVFLEEKGRKVMEEQLKELEEMEEMEDKGPGRRQGLSETRNLSSDPLYVQYGVVAERLGQPLQVADRLPLQVLDVHTLSKQTL